MNGSLVAARRSLILVSASLLVAPSPAQTRWTQIGNMPAPVFMVAYDSVRDRVVACDGPPFQTWEYDGSTWIQAQPSQSPPTFGRTSTYDPLRQRTVHYVWDQTWEWDGVNWSLQNTGTPGIEAMFFHTGRGRAMGFGGTGPGGLPGNDLFEWDGITWTLVPTTNAPPRRGAFPNSIINYGGFAYDQARDALVLFGEWYTGYPMSHPNPVASTWEWSAATGWVQRNAGGLVQWVTVTSYDSRRGRLVSVSTDWVQPPRVSEWDGTGQWTVVTGLPAPPFQGLGGGSVYDSRRGRLLIHPGDLSIWSYESITPARYDPHGPGCPGPLGVTTLAPLQPWTLPWIGGTMSVQLDNLPQQAAFLAMGFSDQSYGSIALPHDLGPLGMPGCFLRLAPEASVLVVSASTSATFILPVPNNLQLRGLAFFQQALVLAAGANPAGLVMSDSIRGVVGWR